MNAELELMLERLYGAAPEELVVAALGLALASLVVRHEGLRRGYLVSRPRALKSLIATTAAMLLFYVSLLFPGAPASAEARGAVVRALLILQAVAFIHWNYEFLKLAWRGWPEEMAG